MLKLYQIALSSASAFCRVCTLLEREMGEAARFFFINISFFSTDARNIILPFDKGDDCHFERQNGEKRRGIPISPGPLKTASQGRLKGDSVLWLLSGFCFLGFFAFVPPPLRKHSVSCYG